MYEIGKYPVSPSTAAVLCCLYDDSCLFVHFGVSFVDNGWSIGFNIFTREAGLFPRRCVKPIQDHSIAIIPPSVPKLRPTRVNEITQEYMQSDQICKSGYEVYFSPILIVNHQIHYEGFVTSRIGPLDCY